MVEPVNSGADLIREIDQTLTATPTLWWLGVIGAATSPISDNLVIPGVANRNRLLPISILLVLKSGRPDFRWRRRPRNDAAYAAFRDRARTPGYFPP